MSKWIENYVKGCAKCQQNKPLTHRTPTPSYKINIPPFAQPFEVVLMDSITQLSNSHGYDAILTIVDHRCTRVALFLPCMTNITGEGIAKLYLKNVYKWFEIPSKIISDRDPRFMSHFSSALCQCLGINRNISTAYHPQTDGLSERKNQWVEQYLQFVTSTSQDDWSNWLAIATAVHNNYPNTTTRIAPIEALLGYSPRITMELPYPPTTVQLIDNRTKEAMEKRKQAKEALNKAAQVTPPDSYQIRDKVWLEAKHLALPYQMPKLTPKRHGPFTIAKRVSSVAYQLKLLTAWTIHDIFHASLLTPYRETIEHGTNYTRPPPDLIEDTEEYEVEAIVNHHHFGRKRQLQYLIKWKGYPDADNMWESADHVHASMLTQAYHRKNPLSSSEQDKRSQKKCKVSIRSLKLFLQQQHHPIPTTCLPPPPTSLSGASSPPRPSLSSKIHPNPLPIHLLPRQLPLPLNNPPIDQPSPLPLIPSPKRVKSFHMSTIMDIPSPPKALSMSYKDMQTSRPGHFIPSPSALPIQPLVACSNTSKLEVRSSSSTRSSPTSEPRCHESQMPNDSPTSPSPMPMASCGKPATSNWATARSPLPSAPLDKTVTLSSNMTCLLPPYIYVIPPPSHSPCGSLTPFLGSHLSITRPLTWPTAQTTGDWLPNWPVIMSQTHGSSTLQPRYTRSIASCRSSRWPAIKATATSRGLEPSIAFVHFRPLTLATPPASTRMRRDYTSAVVGHRS